MLGWVGLHLAPAVFGIESSGGIPLSLLDLLQRLHRAMQSMSVVSPELGVGAFEGGVAVGFGFLDTVKFADEMISHGVMKWHFVWASKGGTSSG
jgi:hypothetical protein